MQNNNFDQKKKISQHIDILFGINVSKALPDEISWKFSRTKRLKSFSADGKLIATVRTDGGLALTVYGAHLLIRMENFLQNCILPIDDVIPFVSEGRSLVCKHVRWCGHNIYCGSDTVVIDNNKNIIATGRSLFHHTVINKYSSGVAVKIREGIKSRDQ